MTDFLSHLSTRAVMTVTQRGARRGAATRAGATRADWAVWNMVREEPD